MSSKSITVFEHGVLKLGTELDQVKLSLLQKFYGEKGVPYYSLIHNGVKFCEFVGVLQIGNLRIEVLPKADKNEDKNLWRNALISMLKTSGALDIHAPSSTGLELKANSILDLYFELFINEIEYLIRRGLVKKYRKTDGNTTSLKGALNISKQISRNLIHKERFYCRYTVYNHDHLIHQIFKQALELIHRLNKNSKLQGRILNLLLSFPEVSDVKLTEKHFNTFQFDRKNEPYRSGFNIAKLLLLNFHPDLMHGKNNVLAIMFDMNVLWERFVYKTLSKELNQYQFTLTSQTTKDFWQINRGTRSRIRPDIIITKDNTRHFVLDTKWKNLFGFKPSSDDLQQMYVYHQFYQAEKVALVYPGISNDLVSGHFINPQDGTLSNFECSIFPIGVNNEDVRSWQREIALNVLKWFEKD